MIVNFIYFSGLITALTKFDRTGKGTFVGILLLLIAICYGIAVGGDLLLLTKVNISYLFFNFIFD